MKRSVIVFSLFLLFMAVTALSVSAQGTMAKSEKMMSDDGRPLVVFVRADWCPYCKKLEPKMSKFVEQYKDKVRFVTLDITNDEMTRKSATIAKDEGLDEFFDSNKTKASTIAIFKDKKQVYSTLHNTDQKDIAAAIDEVLKGEMKK